MSTSTSYDYQVNNRDFRVDDRHITIAVSDSKACLGPCPIRDQCSGENAKYLVHVRFDHGEYYRGHYCHNCVIDGLYMNYGDTYNFVRGNMDGLAYAIAPNGTNF